MQLSEALIDQLLDRMIKQNSALAMCCLEATGLSVAATDGVTVQRQVQHVGASGTADLVVRFWRDNSVAAMLLIENKIDAGFTPNQPTRYAQCRDAHIQRGAAPSIATLLIAPNKYLLSSQLKHSFNGCLSYEALLPYASEQDGSLLQAAIERAESPYEARPDGDVMSFFLGYEQINGDFGGLAIKKCPNSNDARPAASRTIYFDTLSSGFRRYPFLLNGHKPASIRVAHQCWDASAPSASVKLMLGGWARHRLLVAPFLMSDLANSGIHLRAAGQSLALVCDTPRLNNRKTAAAQKQEIEDALTKLCRIREDWNRLEEPLRNAAKALAQSSSIRTA
jgi:hypothetical protein